MPTPSLEDQRSTEGMVDYGRNSAMQQRLVQYHADRIRDLVRRLGLVQPELKIVDYGCGPGPSAIDAVAPAIEAYCARFPEGPISVCHADQPGNDWNYLFDLATGPSGYRHIAETVRIEAAVGSFYDQMVAEGSVCLGTSFVASHWLSHAVCLDAPGTVWFADLTGEARVEETPLRRRLSRRSFANDREWSPEGGICITRYRCVVEIIEHGAAQRLGAAEGRIGFQNIESLCC
jgi:SAM dependent carboxyl methyltransferase